MSTIVILGAGFGGLRCALDLARKVSKDWKVVLIDRNSYHIYFPRLYELAVPKNGKLCAISIHKILKDSQVEFIQGEIVSIDCKERKVGVTPSPGLRPSSPLGRGEGKVVPFDYLILALGAGTDYFGIPGLEKNARTLKSVDDAEVISERVGKFLKYAEAESQDGNVSGLPFSIVIGGAGATGVETAAELAHLFRDIPREKWNIILVEALSQVLWMFPKAVGEYAYKQLTRLGVHTMLDTCIKRIDKGKEGIGVVLAPRPLQLGETKDILACDFLSEREKHIRADLLLWTGGIRANPILVNCGMVVDNTGRLEVDEYMQVRGLRNVFAVGDNVALIDPRNQKPVPANAQAAIEQGKLAAENTIRLLQGKNLKPYYFRDFTVIIPLADRDGVAYAGRWVFTGFFSWLLRKAAYCRYFASILGWWRAVKMISADLRTVFSSKSYKT